MTTMALNVAKLTLFFVVLTSLATSQPFSRSHGTAPRHTGFQWNARRVGNKNVATISIRKDEERDRRSIPLADANATFQKAFGSHSSEVQIDSERRHHSHNHHQQHHHHRHHHGEDEEEEDVEVVDGEVVNDGDGGGGGVGGHSGIGSVKSRLDSSEIYEEEEDESPLTISRPEMLQEILASTGLEMNADVFRNVSSTSTPDEESQEGDRQGSKKNKKKSKKVKRERRRKRNRGRKGRKGKKKNNNRGSRKCRHLKGKEKKQCRMETNNVLSFITENISMSGSEACQYSNLLECCQKVGFLSIAPDELPAVRKCHYRERFFDCMQEQRKVTCDPNFETTGDMKALRKKIRDVIWTTDSCLISEVVEG